MGTYFARDSSYSANNTYSRPNSQGHKHIIYSRVLTGDSCQGRGGLKSAPYKPGSRTEAYDSVVDNVDAPEVYVVFDDVAAYPEYVIKFT